MGVEAGVGLVSAGAGDGVEDGVGAGLVSAGAGDGVEDGVGAGLVSAGAGDGVEDGVGAGLGSAVAVSVGADAAVVSMVAVRLDAGSGVAAVAVTAGEGLAVTVPVTGVVGLGGDRLALALARDQCRDTRAHDSRQQPSHATSVGSAVWSNWKSNAQTWFGRSARSRLAG